MPCAASQGIPYRSWGSLLLVASFKSVFRERIWRMRSTRVWIFMALIMGLVVLAGCSTPLIPLTGNQHQCCTAPQDVLTVRDSVIDYIQQTHDQPVPAQVADWDEYYLPNLNSSGVTMYEYSAQNWVITIAYPVLQLGDGKFLIVITNAQDGFEWVGNVDTQGNILAP